MIVGTAGHVDHGKTALVRALTGIETDRLKEEKVRGITIENGYAYQPLDPLHPDGARLGFVDMPGHERFVPTMLAGATGIGFALLVIAADDGVMPQTREHLQILQLLQMRRGAVALTKIDLVDTDRLTQVASEIHALVAGTFLANAPLMPVSSVSGAGIDALKEMLFSRAAAWHHTQRQDVGNTASAGFRLAVDRCFSLEGRGTVVTGTIHAGTVHLGDTVQILPSHAAGRALTARVRSLHALDRPGERGIAGQRVSLNLAGLERTAVQRGDWVVAESLTHRVDRVAVTLTLLADAKPLQHWSNLHLHVGAAHTMAQVALLEGDRLAPGASMLAELALAVPLHLCHGDRLILRDASAQTTIGGGSVLDVFVPTRGKRAAQRLAILDAQRDDAPLAALRATLEMAPHGVDLTRFAASRNVPIALVPALLAPLQVVSLPLPSGLVACTPSHWRQMQQAITEALEQFHVREPDHAGVERERLRRASLPTVGSELFGALVTSLLENAQIVAIRHVFLALPHHKVAFTDSEHQLWQRIAPLLQAEPFQPPRVRPIATALQVDEETVRRLLGKSARLGHTLRVAHDHFFLDTAVRALAAHIAALSAEAGETNVASFRDRIGTGRKLAVEILEFFNRIGFTRRIHDRHLIRQAAMWQD